jgi:CRP-like cAMP-binding protein
MEKPYLKPAHLRRIKSLALLSDNQLTSFLDYIEIVSCPHSGKIFVEGERGDAMFLVLEGELRVYSKQKSGDMLFLRILSAGDAFGEVALLTEGRRTASVEAVQQSLLVKLSSASLQELISEQPGLAAQFLYHLARTLGKQLGELTTRLRTQREFPNAVTFLQ